MSVQELEQKTLQKEESHETLGKRSFEETQKRTTLATRKSSLRPITRAATAIQSRSGQQREQRWRNHHRPERGRWQLVPDVGQDAP